jgi:hypothetical protein
MLGWLGALVLLGNAAAELPHHIWMEAEYFAPLRGANFSYFKEERQTKGSWSIAGPDVAAAWTQGGESEFMSIAARADEAAQTSVSREVEIPAAGQYTLWVRYADYRRKEETFGIRVHQGGKVSDHVFGKAAVVDELDPMKLLWDWSFGWDKAALPLEKGPARVEIHSTGPTGARRQIDCLCLTTDASYEPAGREKPSFAAWAPLRTAQKAGMPDVEALHPAKGTADVPKSWKIADAPPTFLWNVGEPWLNELKKPAGERIDFPFGVDPPLLNDFTAAYRGKEPEIYSHPLSAPVWHIPVYPTVFAQGSPFLDWLERHPKRRFSILLNYGEPNFPQGSDRAALRATLPRYQDRFVGYIAGENISYAPVDYAVLEQKVRAAKSRTEVLAALREVHTTATVKKFSDYYGAPVTPEEAWAPVISCLSANMEAFSHALCNWGVRRIGHENTGNSPTLARRLAFLRGAARQFGAKVADYQSANLGDSATMYSRQAYFYGASSRYILDNSYDAWAGAGHHWLLKDYLLFHFAGVDAFYNEQGVDMFWKPGGGAAGDDFPVQLSPKGKTAEAVQRLAQAHPRGTQFTPVAFLLDEAHGWAQERFSPGSFGLDPQWNPALLLPGRHEASIRGWFDLAYYPAPETQNEPSSAVRQTYVNGVFGDIFDVIVDAPKRAEIASTYPVLVAAGELSLSEEWGRALQEYVRRGGTLVVSADQLSGPGVKELDLPPSIGGQPGREASSFTWTIGGERVPSNVFRYRPFPAGKDRVLAIAPDGTPIAVSRTVGQGRLILAGIPLGLGVDERPVPLLSLLMRHLTQGLVPVKVTGDVEWVLNRLDDGSWVVALFNNHGVIKPQHGVLPTDHHQARKVTLRVPFGVGKSVEWMTESEVRWQPAGGGATATITLPAGAVRFVPITQKD